MAIDCLIVGHFDTPIQDLASRVRQMEAASGAYSEIRTNCVYADGLHMSYSDLFNRLSADAFGLDVRLSPFDAPNSGAIYLANRVATHELDCAFLNYVSSDKAELTAALEEHEPAVVALTTTF